MMDDQLNLFDFGNDTNGEYINLVEKEEQQICHDSVVLAVDSTGKMCKLSSAEVGEMNLTKIQEQPFYTKIELYKNYLIEIDIKLDTLKGE